jgi:trans-aconitate 2-methyltransferase
MQFRWNPDDYLKFADHRLRPAFELIARIPSDNPGNIYDLGCGPGTVTRLLAERWPGACVTGVDSSAPMLARARNDASDIQWVQGEIATWSPLKPANIIFSNAALHWLDDHQNVFPELFSKLAPGGVLAIQMPVNHAAMSHVVMADVVRSGPWAVLLSPLLREAPVGDGEMYFNLLSSQASSLDIWESKYMHILKGDNAVFEWLRGTALKPLLDALEGPEYGHWKAPFAEQLKQCLNKAYAPHSDGRTVFSFRRLFLIIVK